MTEEIKIPIMDANQNLIEIILTIDNKSNKITLNNTLPIKQEFEGSDLSISLLNMRKHLEEKKYKILCNGSRENIVVSRMSKQMSNGRMGYLVELGKHAHQDSLVDIFSPIDKSLFSSVEQQENFYSHWKNSI